ncbi:MAG: hypothetical protein PHR64_01570 [Candidatus Shapirobacteria bacterium]|nr:hypothetical protein [Candidatus Shapirobacteria bacterium]MDD5073779.1 hypothetical protein [Candidatus Shapirobacteria bacterium]MDD5481620.1 hypothetical protein [Candidatus Shapirobacteria bacterium]
MALNNIESYCPYRITKETFQFFSDCPIPEGQIPFEGICDVSHNRQQVCFYVGSQTQYCLLRKNNDFCDRPWVKENSNLGQERF